MIRNTETPVIVEVNDGNSIVQVKLAGLSTDSKPTAGIATGSSFLEVNTGKVFLFDEVGGTWTEVA